MRFPVTSRDTWIVGRFAAAVGWLALIVGCEPGVSVPAGPSDAGVVAPAASATGTAVPTVGLCLPEQGNLAISAFERAFRHEAAAADAISVVELSPPGKQAETIRDLASRGLSALVVVPAPGEEIGPTLASVNTQGPPVLLFGRPAPSGAESLPRLTYTPYEQTAQALVEAAVEDARKAGFPADAPAVILVNGPYDHDGREILAALHAALDAAQVPTLPDVSFRGFQAEGKAAFATFPEEHPDLAMAFAIEDQGLKAVGSIRDNLDHASRRFVVAGFVYDGDTAKLADYNVAAATAEIRPEILARQALRTALDLIAGQAFPDPILVETRLTRSDGRGPERAGYRNILTPPTPVDPTTQLGGAGAATLAPDR